MDDSQKIISEQLNKLPQQARRFVLSMEWVDTFKNYVSKFNLKEEDIISIEYRIFNILIGLTPFEDLIENITNEINIERSVSELIAKNIEENILDPYSELFPEEDSVFTPNSYEQILINQARAMQPVGVEAEGSMNYESRIMDKNIPENLPTGEIHHASLNSYEKGMDPYREPTE